MDNNTSKVSNDTKTVKFNFNKPLVITKNLNIKKQHTMNNNNILTNNFLCINNTNKESKNDDFERNSSLSIENIININEQDDPYAFGFQVI